MKNQKGFSGIETLLVLVIVGLLGFVGWYIWDSNNKTNDTLENAEAISNNAASQTPIDPTSKWIAYTSTEGKFSLRYPSSWAKATNPEMCSGGLLLLGGNEQSVGKCASDSGGQMTISSQVGDQRASYEMDSKLYPDLKTETVTINGVSGKKQTGTYKMPADAEGIGPEDGDKRVQYVFYTNDRTYVASYSKKTQYPDVLADFTLMVTNTWKFNS